MYQTHSWRVCRSCFWKYQGSIFPQTHRSSTDQQGLHLSNVWTLPFPPPAKRIPRQFQREIVVNTWVGGYSPRGQTCKKSCNTPQDNTPLFFLSLFFHASTLQILDFKPWSQASSLLSPAACLQFFIALRVKQPHCSSSFHRVLLTHATHPSDEFRRWSIVSTQWGECETRSEGSMEGTRRDLPTISSHPSSMEGSWRDLPAISSHPRRVSGKISIVSSTQGSQRDLPTTSSHPSSMEGSWRDLPTISSHARRVYGKIPKISCHDIFSFKTRLWKNLDGISLRYLLKGAFMEIISTVCSHDIFSKTRLFVKKSQRYLPTTHTFSTTRLWKDVDDVCPRYLLTETLV